MNAHTSQQDRRVYRITLQGQLDQEFVEAYCPAGTILTRTAETALLTNVLVRDVVDSLNGSRQDAKNAKTPPVSILCALCAFA